MFVYLVVWCCFLSRIGGIGSEEETPASTSILKKTKICYVEIFAESIFFCCSFQNVKVMFSGVWER